jgi:hypothetical protein
MMDVAMMRSHADGLGFFLDRHGPAGLAMTSMGPSLRGGEADAAIQVLARKVIESRARVQEFKP